MFQIILMRNSLIDYVNIIIHSGKALSYDVPNIISTHTLIQNVRTSGDLFCNKHKLFRYFHGDLFALNRNRFEQ